MGKAGFKVEAWANGYGLWQARVLIPNMAVLGPQVARAARRAIVAELAARDVPRENVGVRFVGMEAGGARYEECELVAK